MKEAKQYGWESSKPTCSHEFIQPKIVSILKRLCREDKTILDVGCGNGAICGSLAALGFKVAGAEYDRQGFEIASRSYPEIKFYNVGVYDSSEEIRKDYPAGFDCVISTEVIEHLFSPQYLPLFASELLKKNGFLILSTPYHGFLKNLALSITNHWDAHLTVLREGGHIKFWSRSTLTKLLRNNGFEVLEFHGCGRLPWLWKSMILVARKMSTDL